MMQQLASYARNANENYQLMHLVLNQDSDNINDENEKEEQRKKNKK